MVSLMFSGKVKDNLKEEGRREMYQKGGVVRGEMEEVEEGEQEEGKQCAAWSNFFIGKGWC